MLAFLIVVIGILLRLLPHIPNFAPITGIAIFSGIYLRKKWALIIPITIMIVSDYLISHRFYSIDIYVWGSFLISGYIGTIARYHKSLQGVLLASLLASLQFFIITNFGVWADGMYSRRLDGLLQSYLMGIPFYKWTLLGDLFYTLTFCGTYEIALIFKKIDYAARIRGTIGLPSK